MHTNKLEDTDNNSSSSTWGQEQVIELIQLYRENTLLWNSDEKGYKNAKLREKVWEAIGTHLGVSPERCRRKIHSLQAQVRREKLRLKRDKSYRSKWHLYKYLEFLKERPKRNSSEYPPMKEEHFNTDDNSSDENFEFVDSGNVDESKSKSETENNIEIEVVNNSKKLKVNNSDGFENNNILHEISIPESNSHERDEFMVYAETVAHRLRKIKNPKKVCVLKHKIDVLLYEAELESYPDTD